MAAMPVEFVADKEPWCQYTLDDGTVIKVRIMLTKAARDGIDGQGNPKYLLSFQQVCECMPSDLALASAKEEQARKEKT